MRRPRNDEIVASLEKVADLLEAQHASIYRIRAYRGAARTLRGLEKPIADLVGGEETDGLESLPGIGKSTRPPRKSSSRQSLESAASSPDESNPNSISSRSKTSKPQRTTVALRRFRDSGLVACASCGSPWRIDCDFRPRAARCRSRKPVDPRKRHRFRSSSRWIGSTANSRHRTNYGRSHPVDSIPSIEPGSRYCIASWLAGP